MSKALIIGALILSAALAVRTSVPHRAMPVPKDPFAVVKDDTSPLHLHFIRDHGLVAPDAPK